MTHVNVTRTRVCLEKQAAARQGRADPDILRRGVGGEETLGEGPLGHSSGGGGGGRDSQRGNDEVDVDDGTPDRRERRRSPWGAREDGIG